MSKVPVTEWDRETKNHVHRGEWQFDAQGATRVLELLGKNAGMFTERVEHTRGVSLTLDEVDALEEFDE